MTHATANTPRPRAPEARLRQLIGIARRQLGIPDDSHAARVGRISAGRTQSTTVCTRAELEAILGEYKAAGFAPTAPRKAGRRPPARRLSRGDMLTRVEQLLTIQELPWGYAEAILRRQRGHDRDAPKGRVATPIHLATDHELRGVIAALDRRRRRLAATTEETPT